MKNNSEGQLNFYVYLILIIVVFIFILYFLSSDVGYEISINNSMISVGNDIILDYDVNNGLVFQSISNVKFGYSVQKINDYDVNYEIIELGELDSRENIHNVVIIRTNSMDLGDYRIWTFLEYWKEGKLQREYLSLDVTLIS